MRLPVVAILVATQRNTARGTGELDRRVAVNLNCR
jgi:hypothetical protein